MEAWQRFEGKTVFSRVRILKLINEGTFGVIYQAIDTELGLECALKISKSAETLHRSVLRNEYEIMKRIKSRGRFLNCSMQLGEHNEIGRDVLIMDRVGCSLEQLLDRLGGKFTIYTVCHIMKEALTRLRELHACGILHRDVKPANFCLKARGQRELYLIDFGISAEYLDEENDHRSCEAVAGFVGTRRFASINVHKGMPNSQQASARAGETTWSRSATWLSIW